MLEALLQQELRPAETRVLDWERFFALTFPAPAEPPAPLSSSLLPSSPGPAAFLDLNMDTENRDFRIDLKDPSGPSPTSGSSTCASAASAANARRCPCSKGPVKSADVRVGRRDAGGRDADGGLLAQDVEPDLPGAPLEH